MALVETAAITARWQVEDVAKKMEKENTVDSPTFDNKRWRMQLVFGAEIQGEKGKFCAVNLRPGLAFTEMVQPDWPRTVYFSFKMLTLEGTLIKDTSDNNSLATNVYDSKTNGWGYPRFASYDLIASKLGESSGVILQVSIYEESALLDPYIFPSRALYKPLEALFEDTTSDVVIKIQAGGDRTNERYLYAHRRILEAQSTYFTKLFGSGFSESIKITSYADLHQSDRARNDQNNDDNDDDSKEWLPALEDDDNEASTVGEADEQRAVDIDRSSARTDASGTTSTVTTSSNKVDEMEFESEISAAESTVDEKMAHRNLRQVTVVDAGWTTYRALLYWMYTRKLCLTGLHSNYLVYLSSLKSAFTGSADGDIILTGASTSSAPVLSRRAWLVSQAEKAGRCTSEDTVEPASPHTMYRLSDKLDIPGVKKLAKRAILDGFTVENVLYELVSTFSYHYAEIQDAALAFCLENWEEVKLTQAFRRVVSEHARIEGASEIFMKLLLKFPAVPNPAS